MTENQRPAVPLRAEARRAAAQPQPDDQWRLQHVALAPHRLGFFLAMVLLIASGLWWALVQVDRVSTALSLPYAVAPSLVHAAVMSFGFFPLFFAGFLFTAGPKWLHVDPPPVSALMAPLLLQAGGWLAWLVGAAWAQGLALAGCTVAWAGLLWMSGLFVRLVLRSPQQDQMHARSIAAACLWGCLCVAGLGLSLAAGRADLARLWVLSGLWGFITVVFAVVAHRMIPFFTASALPAVQAWRPYWVLWLMLVALAVQAAAVWLQTADGRGAALPAVLRVRGPLELVVGILLLWLAWRWGWVQSFRNRLLAMLHVGFMWLGLAFVLLGVAHGWGGLQGASVWDLGALHALTMGCLGSLMLAMVTRVSCGHSGRALVADQLAWGLFWLLQLATVLRLAATAPLALAPWLLALAALLWAGIMAVWGLRLAAWYGKLRVDGKPG